LEWWRDRAIREAVSTLKLKENYVLKFL
jgi:hypothetical protein